MNRLLILLSFLLLTTMAFTQETISITVTGVVADIDGNGIANVDVNIGVDSTQIIDFYYYNTITTDDDGSYSDTFDVPAELTQGIVYAWMQNCDNTYLSEQGFWHPGGSPVIDFLYCNVNCSVEIIDTIGGVLNTLQTGEAPFSYAWNTGETTPNIVPGVQGNYCVTTTDANGCQSNDCFYFAGYDTLCSVVIIIDSAEMGGLLLTAIASGEAPFSYLWDTGENTQSIHVTEDGEHCLSVVDAMGCVSATCLNFETLCDESVFITEDSDGLHLVTNYQGEASYSWTTGETTSSIVPQSEGEYCVLMSYGENCVASSCYYYGDSTGVDSCYVNIDLVQNGGWLQATAAGVAPFTFAWSNGSTSNAIEITEDTLYCVTVIDAVGCSSYSCYDAFDLPVNIEGFLSTGAGDSIFIGAVVDLFALADDEVTFVASTEAFGGYYNFEDVASGNYIVRAVVDGYLPTYHLSSMWWDEADIITPTVGNNQWYNIELIGVDGLVAGPGGITGTVSEPDGFGGHDDDSRGFDPIEGAEIILFNSQNEPIAYVFSNTDGAYAFDNLAYGTYTVYIELVGYQQVFYTITIGEDNEIVNNVNFIVDIDNETITTATKEVILDENLLSIFPNPVKADLMVRLNTQLRTDATIEVINITGQTVLTTTFSQYEQQKSIDVTTLNTGLYLLKITTEDGIIVQQFVKQ